MDREIDPEISGMIKKEQELMKYAGEDRVIDGVTYHANKSDYVSKSIPFTKLPTLSNYLDGVVTGEMFVVAGYTGNGKTLLAKTLMYDLMYQGHKTMFLSYEVNPLEWIPEEKDLREEFCYLPMELKTMCVPWLIDRIWEAKVKYNVTAVFIDHLHFIVDMMTTNNMSLNIGATMRLLKQAAIKLNVAIFVLAHTGQPREGIPNVSDIRDSSFIAQEADGVLIIHRLSDAETYKLLDLSGKYVKPNTYETNAAIVMVEKARRSGVYKKYVLLKKIDKYFAEMIDG